VHAPSKRFSPLEEGLLMPLEKIAIYLWFGGLALMLLGSLWLWVNAFRTRVWWGLGFLVVLPIVAFIFKHFRRAWAPLLTCVAGAGLVIGARQLAEVAVAMDLEGIETVTDAGENAIILTGWKYQTKDYEFLKDKGDTVVLKMANGDVTDDTLKYLQNMKKLKKLDLNNTQVTDSGLVVLKNLPELEALDLMNTKITDTGLREHLLGMQTLRFLTVTGTSVTKEAVKEWRAGGKGRKAIGP
jgi:Leucine Rich repeats (2 copies)